MATAILELIVIVLKLVLYIINVWLGWKMEERQRFEERMKNLTDLLKKAVENKEESINEEDFLSNLEWEVQERYKNYKDACFQSLSSGKGIEELKKQEILGMNLRIAQKEESVVEILVKDIKIEEKSKRIAKLLVEK